jgi:hypothetical protein
VAQLMDCPHCGAGFDPRRAMTCPNGHLVAGVRARRPAAEEAPPAPPAPAGDPCGACGAELPAGVSECPFCGASAATGARLRFSFGEAVVPDGGRLELGRLEGFSTLASALDAFDGVSRRHALIEHIGDGLRVTDLGSMNGTFVDGRRLAPQLAEPLPVGAQLRLGQSCSAEVLG